MSLLVFYVICNDISVIYVTTHMCRRIEELYLRKLRYHISALNLFVIIPVSRGDFFSQNQSKEIFFEIKPSPPPPQNIKLTVP